MEYSHDLIQRLSLKKGRTIRNTDTLKDVFHFDHMGSGNFKFNQTPRSIKRMILAKEQFNFSKIHFLKRTYYLYHNKNKISIKEIEGYFYFLISDDHISISLNFPYRESKTNYRQTDGWFDINNDLIWSIHDLTDNLSTLIKNSTN